MSAGAVSAGALLAPVLVLVAMTFALLLWSGRMRFAAVGRGEVKMRDVALREPNWPQHITKVANCFQNQLELPLLFYVLVALVLATGVGSVVDLVLAWAFVAARLAHAAVFVTSNDLRKRGPIFVVGMAVLALHWGWFALRLYAL
ncbi:MAPEG family protein [Salinarimonas sp.]|uniref:MAPEG family protein n=1 Tax=Salinarimonas sp. TaxID=2766526 RepID=UPI0032D8C331